jgi:Na+-transporting methylmalonyl-CoA/oxaloacetate decarboxylase gamma subunit
MKKGVTLFFAGVGIVSTCLALGFVALVIMASISVPSVPVAVRQPVATPRPTLRPTPRPTTAPEKCYIEVVITDGVDEVSVYVVATGKDARQFCDYGLNELAEPQTDADGFTTYAREVRRIPDYPVWCTERVGNVKVQVVAEYEFIGIAFCEGFNNPSSFDG